MTYEIGQQIGVCYISRGSRSNRYKIGVVAKVSKTRVIVRIKTVIENVPKYNDVPFSIKTGRRIGDSDSWYPVRLVTVEQARKGQASFCQRIADASGLDVTFLCPIE